MSDPYRRALRASREIKRRKTPEGKRRAILNLFKRWREMLR